MYPWAGVRAHQAVFFAVKGPVFVFDPTPDFLAMIHGLRANPLPGLRTVKRQAAQNRLNRALKAATNPYDGASAHQDAGTADLNRGHAEN